MEQWDKYWSIEKFQPIIRHPEAILYGGTNHEPLASMGMACFLDAVKEDFKEGFTVIDYGCGAGILANFISARLKEFTYCGLEPDSAHGLERIALGRASFKDPRVSFGVIEADFSKQITNPAKRPKYLNLPVDAIILISVFTHLSLDDIYGILDRLIPVFDYNPDCSIVFSCFIDTESRVANPQPHIGERFYGEAYIALSDLNIYCVARNVVLEKHMDFTAMGGFNHQIFKITSHERRSKSL